MVERKYLGRWRNREYCTTEKRKEEIQRSVEKRTSNVKWEIHRKWNIERERKEIRGK